MTTILLLRHGETSFNVGHQFRGRADPPLTEVGDAQARAAGGRADLRRAAAVYTSPRRRAQHTAAAVLRGGAPTVDERLDDLDYGAWTGKTPSDVRATDADRYQAWLERPGDVAFPGGEAVASVVQRARAALQAYLAAHRDRTVVAVTHDVIIRLLLCSLLDAPLASMHRFEIGLTSVTTIEWTRTLVVRGVNDLGHLRS